MIDRLSGRLPARVCVLLCLSLPASMPALAAPLQFTLSIPDDRATVVPGVDGDRISLTGGDWKLPLEPGAPELPYRLVRIVLPQGQQVDTFRFEFDAGLRVAAAFKPVTTVIWPFPTAGPSGPPPPRPAAPISA
jgi:hypothetical protein